MAQPAAPGRARNLHTAERVAGLQREGTGHRPPGRAGAHARVHSQTLLPVPGRQKSPTAGSVALLLEKEGRGLESTGVDGKASRRSRSRRLTGRGRHHRHGQLQRVEHGPRTLSVSRGTGTGPEMVPAVQTAGRTEGPVDDRPCPGTLGAAPGPVGWHPLARTRDQGVSPHLHPPAYITSLPRKSSAPQLPTP